MENLLIYFVGAAISIGILYFVIYFATKTDKKLDLLAKIEARNGRIEVILAHLISTKAPKKEVDLVNCLNSGDYLLSASKIINNLKLGMILENETIEENEDKILILGKLRNLYIKDCLNKDTEKSKNVIENEAIDVYELIIIDFTKYLSVNQYRFFIDCYRKGTENSK